MFSYWHEPVSKASDTITEDGFKYSYGRFTTVQPSNVERIDGTRLRELFLPVVTSEAKRLMQRDRDFVVGQLKHYDISYEPKEYTGNGANLLKKLLKEGKVGTDGWLCYQCGCSCPV